MQLDSTTLTKLVTDYELRLGTIVPNQILKSFESTQLISTLETAIKQSKKVPEWEEMIIEMKNQNPKTTAQQEGKRIVYDLNRLKVNQSLLKLQEIKKIPI